MLLAFRSDVSFVPAVARRAMQDDASSQAVGTGQWASPLSETEGEFGIQTAK